MGTGEDTLTALKKSRSETPHTEKPFKLALAVNIL